MATSRVRLRRLIWLAPVALSMLATCSKLTTRGVPSVLVPTTNGSCLMSSILVRCDAGSLTMTLWFCPSGELHVLTVWPAMRVRRLWATTPTDKPKSLAASRLSVTSTVGLLGLTLESRSTKPGMPSIRAMTCRLTRSSSRKSGPVTDNSICLLPLKGSSMPTCVTVIPLMPRKRSRKLADMALAPRVRWSRSTSRTYMLAYILPCVLPVLMVLKV